MSTPNRFFMLRELGLFARLGVAGLVITMLGGTAASGIYLWMHHGDRDEQPGLTIDDVKAHYHGIVSESVLRRSLESGHPETLEDRERQILYGWLDGDTATLSQRYDDLDLGIDAPAEIIAINCLDCHARSATGQIDGMDTYPELPLEYWDDVYDLAISRTINPVDTEILAASTHTHALGMASMGIAIAVLALLTGWPKLLLSVTLCATGVGLVADIGGWWLTSLNASFATLVVIGGGLFSGGMTVLSLLILADLCMPKPAPTSREDSTEPALGDA